MYSGNLGLAHSFESIFQAATELQIGHPQICFVFVGDGPRLSDLLEDTRRRSLGNVRFLPPQPLEMLGTTLSAADVHIATMQENLKGLVVPSKVYGILAAGKPCIFLGPNNNEVAQLIHETETGRVLCGPNSSQLASILSDWSTRSAEFNEISKRAQRLAGEFGLGKALKDFTLLFEALLHRGLVTPADLPVLAAQQRPTSTAI